MARAADRRVVVAERLLAALEQSAERSPQPRQDARAPERDRQRAQPVAVALDARDRVDQRAEQKVAVARIRAASVLAGVPVQPRRIVVRPVARAAVERGRLDDADEGRRLAEHLARILARVGVGRGLARLALLKTQEPYYRVLIFAVEKSIGYYRRMGFMAFQPWKDKEGKEHPSGVLEFSSRDVRCRKLLAAHGITFPEDEEDVPMHQAVGQRLST